MSSTDQGWTICEALRQGIRSRVHGRGYYALLADLSSDIRRSVLGRIGGAVNAT